MSFISERQIKATRKRHLCSACDKWIEIGESAVNWAGINDGLFNSVHYHPDCRKAEVAYNETYLDRHWSDDWYPLYEREPDDNAWIKENFPVPYMRLCMTREQYADPALRTKALGAVHTLEGGL